MKIGRKTGMTFWAAVAGIVASLVSFGCPLPLQPQGASIALCAHLNAIGCLQLANCAQTLDKVEANRTTDLKVKMLMAATSKAQAIAVGTVSCAE
jgi:hypothetical protein